MNLQTIDTKTSVDVDTSVFEYLYNEGLIHQAVTAQLNSLRSGNSAQKTRSEVRGGGRKPWKQKGTGRARAGTIRSPIWRSGGVTFASKKRDYTQKINKKMYVRALRSILSELIRQKRLHIVSDFQIGSPRTKDFIAKMNELALSNALVITFELNANEYLGSRNLRQYDVIDIAALNPVDLLSFDNIVMTVDALKNIEERLQ
ncbi:MAG: 50S ribosomal protein L4 [Legionellaceae bacterium]|nr:50S ribosomal protein L4 [Legionellaceae bacterium]